MDLLNLKYIKIGRSVKYRKADLDEFINSRVMTSTKTKANLNEPPKPLEEALSDEVNNDADRESLMIVSESLVKLSDVIKRHSELPVYTKGIPSKAYKAVLDIMRDCFFELECTMKGQYQQAEEYRNFVSIGLNGLRLSGLV